MFQDPWAEFEQVGGPPSRNPQGMPQPLIQRPRTAPLPARDPLSIASEQQQMQAREQGMRTEEMRQRNLGLDIAHNEERNRRLMLGAPLTPAAESTLRETAGMYRALRQARDGFQDGYAGNLLGGIENTLQEVNANWGTPGQRDWWAAFQRSDIGERNQLFGATLTPSESAAFAGTTVSARTDPRSLRENLERRYEAAQNSLRRQREFLIANGFRPEAVDALIGEDMLADFAAPQQQGGQLQAQQGARPQQQQLPPPPSISDRYDASAPSAAPGAPPGTELANGRTRIERDPALRGVNRRIGNMMIRGAPDAEIRSYVNQLGLGQSVGQSLDQALEFRRDRNRWNLWRRQNPNRAYPVEIEMREVEMGPGRRLLSGIADSPVGAYGVSAANMLSGQRLDQMVGAAGGDEEMARAGIQQLRQENPFGSFAGDVSGGVLMSAGGNMALGRAGLTAALPRMLATEGAIGAAQGQGLNREDPLMGAAQGAGLGMAGGAVMRGATNIGARAVAPTGGKLAPIYAERGQPSIGQRMGGLFNRAEEAFASVPYAGAAQRGTRELANEAAERGVFNRALRNIPPNRTQNGAVAQVPRDVPPGPEAWRIAYDNFDGAYNSVHGQMTFRLDNRIQQSLVQAQQNARRLSSDSAARFERIIADDVFRPISENGGALTGRQFQQVLSNLRTTARNVRNNKTGDQEFVQAIEVLEDALMRGAVRNSPREAIRDLRRIDRGYAQLMRAERAAMQGSAARDPGRLSANDLMRAERSFGDRRRFLRGEQEGAEYAAAWNRLGRTVPDSGSPERAGYMAAGTGLWGGAGAGVALVDPWMASPLIANTIANLPGVRKGVNFALDPGRAGPNARHIRDMMIRNRQYPGGAGAGVAPQFLMGDPY